jgi:FSR family fosmidomycin resistance protein-like MFS transporter
MSTATASAAGKPDATLMRVLLALSIAHLLNDTLQAVIPALYPILKGGFGLTFTQIGAITFTYQLTGSLLQPVVGNYTDRRPLPYSLPIGMTFTFVGLTLFGLATDYRTLILAAMFSGTGSAIFHPEASRLARLASGGRYGFAQSLFQVGGNFGTALGPLLIAIIVAPRTRTHVLWFLLVALGGIFLLSRLSRWYSQHLDLARAKKRVSPPAPLPLPRRQVITALIVLGVLIFSKYFYLASLTNYYTFYLIHRFGVSVQNAQFALFAFLFAVAAGTIIGGPVGDRWGRKYVIWISILGAAPFTLLLPFTGLALTLVLSMVIGFILASEFSAILVYATELVPGKVGFISGLFFGFAFGVAAIASALMGKVADQTSIETVFRVCAYLPLLGIVAVFLPNLHALNSPAPVDGRSLTRDSAAD